MMPNLTPARQPAHHFLRATLLVLLALEPIVAVAQVDGASPLQPLAINRPSTQEQIKALPDASGQLFIAADQPPRGNGERALSVEPRVVRARSVAIDVDHLNGMLGAQPLQLGDQGNVGSATPQHVLNLFDDLAVRVVKLSQQRDDLGNIVWQGGIVDDPYGSATVVIDDGEVTASVRTQGRTISIMPTADGSHVIRELRLRSSREAFEPAARVDDFIKSPPPAGVDPTPPAPATGERAQSHAANTLRVLFVYTAKAANEVANMSSAASLAMADLNTTFINSQVHARGQIVGLERVAYTEGTNSSKILNDASDGVGDFARIQNMRAVVDADLIAVLASYGNENCGIAWKNDDIDQFPNSLASYVKYGVSLTSINCLPTTFTHEVGHNLGASHDRFVEKTAVAGPQGYNYGYIDTTAKFADIMAYYDECDSLNITCSTVQYFSNPNVNYNGRPVGVPDSDPKAANNARKINEITPFMARLRDFLPNPTTPMLAVFVSGSGTVTSSAGGINCGQTCAASVSGGGQVTLTPVAASGWQFTGWSGACSGSGTCAVSMTTSRSVEATFQPSLRLGTVYSSAQGSSQSFLRFANTGSSASTVNVVLADSATGQSLGTWTSPSVAAGAALQVPITTIEAALTPGTARPQFFAAAVQSQMTGYIQHVLYRPADGTLTNLSTCDSGVTVNASQVANVHSTILDFGFPSSIAVTNTDSLPGTATLGIFDSTNGARLGTYTTSSIPANSQSVIAIATIENTAGIRPTSTQFHYTIKLEGTSFEGALQHLVNNVRAGVVTDMTTVCAYGTVTAPPSTVAVRQPGPIFSSAQSASQSFLRFFNTGANAGTVNVRLYNSTSGTLLGNWTSPSIPAGASAQYPITTVESMLSGSTTKPQYYTTLLQTQISGFFQHVLYRPADGTLTNLSSCDAGVASSPGNLINVHSSILDFGFPSSVVVSNPTPAAITATLGIFDATTGARLGSGSYSTASIAAGARLIIPISAIQSALGINPGSTIFHYVIKAEGTFNGFLQHLVNNSTVGVVTDMTTMCQLPAIAANNYNICYPTSCPATVGTAVNGQLKRTNTWENYRYAMTGGQSYTIEVRGSSTSNGTLVRPYVYIYDANFNIVGEGGGGGSGNNARVTFTPPTTGNYVVQVTAYTYNNNGGTFVLTVN